MSDREFFTKLFVGIGICLFVVAIVLMMKWTNETIQLQERTLEAVERMWRDVLRAVATATPAP